MTTRKPKRRKRHSKPGDLLNDIDLEMHKHAMKLDRKRKPTYIA